MRITLKTLFTKSLFIFLFILFLPTLSLGGEFKVTRVYDGDKILVVRDHTVIRKVKLVGIDAPETSQKKYQPEQPYSQQAKEYLAGLILNKKDSIINYDLDVNNRVLGVVFWEGININLQMLRSGLAEVYRGNPPKGLDLEPYWEAEKKAKAAMRGMWSLGDKYTSPKEWRRMHREK
jgi:endonuclease YncB( thermonuclease family)